MIELQQEPLIRHSLALAVLQPALQQTLAAVALLCAPARRCPALQRRQHSGKFHAAGCHLVLAIPFLSPFQQRLRRCVLRAQFSCTPLPPACAPPGGHPGPTAAAPLSAANLASPETNCPAPTADSWYGPCFPLPPNCIRLLACSALLGFPLLLHVPCKSILVQPSACQQAAARHALLAAKQGKTSQVAGLVDTHSLASTRCVHLCGCGCGASKSLSSPVMRGQLGAAALLTLHQWGNPPRPSSAEIHAIEPQHGFTRIFRCNV